MITAFILYKRHIHVYNGSLWIHCCFSLATSRSWLTYGLQFCSVYRSKYDLVWQHLKSYNLFVNLNLKTSAFLCPPPPPPKKKINTEGYDILFVYIKLNVHQNWRYFHIITMYNLYSIQFSIVCFGVETLDLWSLYYIQPIASPRLYVRDKCPYNGFSSRKDLQPGHHPTGIDPSAR